MKLISLLSLLAFVVPSTSLFAEESRTWTNTQGIKIQGTLIEKSADTATLTLENGKTAKVKIAQLSKADIDYLKAWTPEAGETTEPKPPAPKPGGKKSAAEAENTIAEDNFAAPWPKSTSVPVEIPATTISEKDGEYIYETEHFRFECTAKLTLAVIRKLSCIFEATFEANTQLPLNFHCRKIKENPQGHKFVAKLYELDNQFMKVCSSETAAGVFIYPDVHVPFSSLGLKIMGSAYALDKGGDSKTLIHEITHQMSITKGRRAFPTWYTEGVAEYVGLTPYSSGKFNFAQTKRYMITYVLEYGKRNSGGRALGKDISIPPLQDYLVMPHSEFMLDPQVNYGFSALLAYYFFHIDGNKDGARIKEFAKSLQKDPNINLALEKLLDGRSWDQLEKDVQKGMKQFTANVSFTGASRKSKNSSS